MKKIKQLRAEYLKQVVSGADCLVAIERARDTVFHNDVMERPFIHRDRVNDFSHVVYRGCVLMSDGKVYKEVK